VSNTVLSSVMKTGIDLIDEQHQVLIDLISEFDEAVNNNMGKEVLGRTLDEVVNYIGLHFNTEEDLLLRHGYPGFDGHRLKHNKLVNQVLKFREKYNKGIPNMESEIRVFLMDWVVSHINKSDMDYVPFVTGNENQLTERLIVNEKSSAISQTNNTASVGVEKVILPDDCYTGIEEIDNQHLGLIDLINKLDETIMNKNTVDSKPVLEELVDYTKSHFGMEEELLQKNNYPHIEDHIGKHKNFIKKISKFQKMCNDGVGCGETEIVVFLKDWLLKHIKKTDMEFVSYIDQSNT